MLLLGLRGSPKQAVPRQISTLGRNARWPHIKDHFSAEAGQRGTHNYWMGNMKRNSRPSEREIDELVAKEADDNSSWGKPVRVRRSKSASLSLPPDLASRAAFFAHLHRERSVEAWIKRIVVERIDTEEAVFAALKRELGSN